MAHIFFVSTAFPVETHLTGLRGASVKKNSSQKAWRFIFTIDVHAFMCCCWFYSSLHQWFEVERSSAVCLAPYWSAQKGAYHSLRSDCLKDGRFKRHKLHNSTTTLSRWSLVIQATLIITMGGGGLHAVKVERETEDEPRSEGELLDRDQSLTISLHLMPIFFVQNAVCEQNDMNAVRDSWFLLVEDNCTKHRWSWFTTSTFGIGVVFS